MSEKDLSAVFPYQDQTEEAIRRRMLSAVDPSWDQSEGSFIWDSLSPAAIEFALAYIRAKEVLQWGFATTTFGPYLDARGAERGIFRRPAQKAVGEVTVEGAAGVYIPEGTMFATEADELSDENLQYFVTTADGTIPGNKTLTLPVACTKEGSTGNVLPQKITIAVSKISGLTKIDNADAMSGGVDEETDEAFLNRYLKHVRNPGASGNIADYIRWAQEADASVGKVQVSPIAGQPGHVQVLLVDLEDRPATAGLIKKVQDYIDPNSAGGGAGMAPIGAKIHVETPTQLVLSLRLRLTVIRGYEEAGVKRAVVQNISKYLRTLVLNPEDRFVRLSKVGQAIMMTEGVQDFDQLTMAVDGVPVTQNLEIAADAMVVLAEANVEWLQAGE
ncbi:putative phage protein gp47/JayE [Tumebacillus sp. BK434]|uniref:baseplate J/gp47 family protein n=1 Tax=Tumebacillus sp. BK434 TaxID=2512169 RepID=UPI0010510D66|nr:baseplate J/gp47 family protein [Tumebacillus sp. BK434]TCP57983.1 putative phage protein gp47/JayE [Tumebacillus sp. BK434]